jgi:Uma2 family endonuclease
MSVATDWDRPAPGEWTTDDLDALPDDGRRHELIDGVPIVSPSPTTGHQRIAMLLGAALDSLCPPELAVTQAVDVRINRRRSLTPDVLVATADATERNVSHYLPTEVVSVVEIVSPGSLAMDRIMKPALYAEAGIPHFWRVETDGGVRVATYRLDVGTDVYTSTGEFDDVIDVTLPFAMSLPIATFLPRR